jgi:DNA repair protein RecO (recombination protein O)
MLINTEGIVLKQVKYNESDKILTIFSKKNGKIQAIAKGARRPRSPLLSSTQVFCHSNFVIYKGKNMYNISQGEVLNSFYSLREDLKKLAYATYIIELIDTAVIEEEPNDKLFGLTLKTLKLLSKMASGYKKLVLAFEIKYISFLGYKPHIERCVGCSSIPKGRMKFSITDGGIICEKCIKKGVIGEDIDITTLDAMRFLLYNELDKLNSLQINDRVIEKIEYILLKYIKSHVDKKHFKSLDFLKTIEY